MIRRPGATFHVHCSISIRRKQPERNRLHSRKGFPNADSGFSLSGVREMIGATRGEKAKICAVSPTATALGMTAEAFMAAIAVHEIFVTGVASSRRSRQTPPLLRSGQ